jgi:hypothetical protein
MQEFLYVYIYNEMTRRLQWLLYGKREVVEHRREQYRKGHREKTNKKDVVVNGASWVYDSTMQDQA